MLCCSPVEQNTVGHEMQPQLTEEVARRIRQLRLQLGLSARELAEMCASAGQPSLTRSTIAKIESGVRDFITIDELDALARALDIQPHDLVGPLDPSAAGGRSRVPRAVLAAAVPVEVDRIADEIRSLHKGRGLQAGDLEQRLGPLLTELASDRQGSGAVVRRQKLISEITTCSNHLAADLRAAIFASLALSGETRQMPYFKDRLSWLASHLRYEYRTALRRIDTAERLLSEEIARELTRRRGRTAAPLDGWRLKELRTLVRLDTPTPEAHEHRRIVATRPDLTEVMAWLDIPPGPGQTRSALSAEVLYGGKLERREHPSASRFQFVIQFPTPLQPGEEHEYGLLLRIPGQSMRPHVIFSPELPCDVYDLRIRFDPGNQPAWIRRVDGETVRMLDHADPAYDMLTLDDAGEAHVRFDNPTMYLCYGVQWAHQQPGAGLEAHG